MKEAPARPARREVAEELVRKAARAAKLRSSVVDILRIVCEVYESRKPPRAIVINVTMGREQARSPTGQALPYPVLHWPLTSWTWFELLYWMPDTSGSHTRLFEFGTRGFVG